MSKINVLGAIIILALATSATGQPLPEQGVPPEHGVLYARELSTDALVARTREVSVRVETQQGGGDGFKRHVLRVETAGGQSAQYLWPDDPYRPDEIYLLDGYACSQNLIDVVVRSAPPEYADIPSFSYVRFLVDRETLELMALIPHDPSVRAAQGIAPIQSVTAPDAPWPVFLVACDGDDIGGVTVREGFGL